MLKNNLWALLKGIIFTGIFVILIMLGVSVDMTRWTALNLGLPINRLIISEIPISKNLAESLLKGNNVLMASSSQQPLSKYLSRQLPAELLVFNLRALATSDPDFYLDGDEGSPLPESLQTSEILESKETNPESDYYSLFKGYVVTLYCTHSGETYIPDSGAARVEGGPGLINQVAIHLGASLKEKGLQSKFISTIHDYPDFTKSYTNSRKTVARVMAAEGQKMLALFDIHRDSIPGVAEGQKATINGRKAAPILIIVGTNERKTHPHWRENLDFAQRIYKEGEKLYPGLIKGVRTKSGTYNQEFFNHALLLEFGTDYNSPE